ncbi:MAG: type II toxin-antitoxin system RelE family toxin [Leptolyngbya sp. IPPAS B-1204]|nr:type II toxin-antitoxin system RelE/ParE family toxin [Elainella sp. C42_A2020_010]RNJ68612.1 MAG: type II toxin-antitoxin system RelE/ParE family toxin [Leptolyngbya sp. IPPAS B-1204]
MTNSTSTKLVQKQGDLSDFYKLRIGDYRVIYDLDSPSQTIVIMRVGHRREIYDL